MFKVIVAGSRTIRCYDLVRGRLDELLANVAGPIEVVSGGADGADALGERYAREREHRLQRFPADWHKHGKRAGILRNRQMARHADALVAFWDGRSTGTADVIRTAREQGLKVRVVKCEVTPNAALTSGLRRRPGRAHRAPKGEREVFAIGGA